MTTKRAGPQVGQRRAIARASVAYAAGKPYRAYEILAAAGLGDRWRDFERAALKAARARYAREMAIAVRRA